MSRYEKKVADKLRREGFTVMRNGWPDFTAFKRDSKGKITDLFFVEVKGCGDKLRQEQTDLHAVLRSIGLPVFVDIEENQRTYWNRKQREYRLKKGSVRQPEETAKLERERDKRMMEHYQKDLKARMKKPNPVLSERQTEILKLTRLRKPGYSPYRDYWLYSHQEIAHKLGISLQTVKNHLWKACKKLAAAGQDAPTRNKT